MTEIKSTLELIMERLKRMDSDAEERTQNSRQRLSELEARVSRTDSESIELASIYHDLNDWTNAIKTIERVPDSQAKRDVQEDITDSVTRELDTAFAAFKSFDYACFEQRSQALLEKLKCRLTYFFCGLSEIMQGKPDTHIQYARDPELPQVGTSIVDYVRAGLHNELRRDISDAMPTMRSLNSFREAEERYRLKEVMQLAAIYEPDHPDTLVELSRRLRESGRDHAAVLILSDYLPDCSSYLALLKDYHDKTYHGKDFPGISKYSQAGILQSLSTGLKGRNNRVATMVMDKLLDANNGILQTLGKFARDVLRLCKSRFSLELGDYWSVLLNFHGIENPLMRVQESLNYSRAGYALGFLDAVRDAYDFVTETKESLAKSNVRDVGLHYFINGLEMSTRNLLLKSSMYDECYSTFLTKVKGSSEWKLATAETQESTLEALCMMRAVYMATLNHSPEDILGEINSEIPGVLTEVLREEDGGLSITSAGGLMYILRPSFRRFVSQEVVVSMTASGKCGELCDGVSTEKFRDERAQYAININRPALETAAAGSIIDADTLMQNIYSVFHGSTMPGLQTDKHQANYTDSSIIKRFSSESDFQYELAAIRAVLMNPVVNVPQVVKVAQGNGYYVIQLKHIVGVDLCDVVFSLPNRIVSRELINHHLLALAYLQDAAKELPLDFLGKRTIKPVRQDYGTAFSNIAREYGLPDDAACILDGFTQIPYRDASLFNCRLDILGMIAKESTDEMIDLTLRTSSSTSFDEKRWYVGRLLREVLQPFTQNTVHRLEKSMHQIDLGSFKKSAFPLEDFILAVDNPFFSPSEEEIFAFMGQYEMYLGEFGGVKLSDRQQQLAVGGMYRQLKNYHYIRTGRLDYQEMNEQFMKYYLSRALHYAETMRDTGMDDGKVIKALARLI